MNARRLASVLWFALTVAAGGAGAQVPSVVIQSVAGDFEDVKERVVMAIEARGMVLNYTAKIGDMLERTGKDIGRDRPIYHKAELFEFCSSKLSRDAMEADARNIVFCPYAIAVYSMQRDPKKIYVSYRKLGSLGSEKSLKALRAVDRMLEEIVREAMQ
jgi:uncharacterized protein (DUF302 family)